MRKILFVVLTMVCSAALADWDLTDIDPDGFSTYWHNKKTMRKNGDIVRMWTMQNLLVEKSEITGNKFKSAKIQIAYNCRRETLAILSSAMFSDAMGKGKNEYLFVEKEKNIEWIPIFPESIGEQEWNIACRKR